MQKQKVLQKLLRNSKALQAIEKRHEERYALLSKLIKEGKVFKKTKKTVWICRNCGHIHVGTTAPKVCPVCAHPQSYFEVYNEEF